MLRLLPFIAIPFKIWMFVDAVRRRADAYWLWCIVLMPFGELLYFVAVKLRDPDMQRVQRKLLASMKRPPTARELRHRFASCPSQQNRLALAQGLFDAGNPGEARTHFEAILTQKPDDMASLYGLGVCHLELGDPDAAIEPLEQVVTRQAGYRDYAAWPELAEALYRSGRTEACHALLEDLVRTTPRLPHSLLRADYLRRDERLAEAEAVLRAAIEDDEHAPRYVRRQNRRWMRQARGMLRGLAAG